MKKIEKKNYVIKISQKIKKVLKRKKIIKLTSQFDGGIFSI